MLYEMTIGMRFSGGPEGGAAQLRPVTVDTLSRSAQEITSAEIDLVAAAFSAQVRSLLSRIATTDERETPL